MLVTFNVSIVIEEASIDLCKMEIENVKQFIKAYSGRVNEFTIEPLKPSPIQELKCPDCGGKMVSRKGKYGTFWGCATFPKCSGTRDSEGKSKADREKERETKESSQQEQFYRFNK